jgi:zinc protease
MTPVRRFLTPLRALGGGAALTLLFTFATEPAHAMKIQTLKSPGGIEAWLVEERGNPMMALKFSFEGGSSQDPKGKEGVANFVTAMLDEGAGDLPSGAFQERMEELAMRMRYEDSRDAFYGSFETLTKNRDKAVELLRTALTAPRFDKDAVDRIRKQLAASLAYAARDPQKVASREWFATAFEGHSYDRPVQGTPESVGAITRDDLAAYSNRIFAKDRLKVVAVGDINAEELGKLIDRVFGDLPEHADLLPVAKAAPVTGGIERLIEMNVPQSVAVFGLGAMPRKDPDFMTAFLLNQLIGGGGFASRLMEEVREKRGLAYSVYSYIQPYRHASVFLGGVATKTDAITQSLDVIRKELKQIAESGPTRKEFDSAKSFLIGSYALRFDTNSKIASQLLGLFEDDFGPDYIDTRNAQLEAITLEDAKRVAKGLLENDNLIVTIVGKPPTTQANKG